MLLFYPSLLVLFSYFSLVSIRPFILLSFFSLLSIPSSRFSLLLFSPFYPSLSSYSPSFLSFLSLPLDLFSFFSLLPRSLDLFSSFSPPTLSPSLSAHARHSPSIVDLALQCHIPCSNPSSTLPPPTPSAGLGLRLPPVCLSFRFRCGFLRGSLSVGCLPLPSSLFLLFFSLIFLSSLFHNIFLILSSPSLITSLLLFVRFVPFPLPSSLFLLFFSLIFLSSLFHNIFLILSSPSLPFQPTSSSSSYSSFFFPHHLFPSLLSFPFLPPRFTHPLPLLSDYGPENGWLRFLPTGRGPEGRPAVNRPLSARSLESPSKEDTAIQNRFDYMCVSPQQGDGIHRGLTCHLSLVSVEYGFILIVNILFGTGGSLIDGWMGMLRHRSPPPPPTTPLLLPPLPALSSSSLGFSFLSVSRVCLSFFLPPASSLLFPLSSSLGFSFLFISRVCLLSFLPPASSLLSCSPFPHSSSCGFSFLSFACLSSFFPPSPPSLSWPPFPPISSSLVAPSYLFRVFVFFLSSPLLTPFLFPFPPILLLDAGDPMMQGECSISTPTLVTYAHPSPTGGG
ncbi:hypothetical protein C7M84_019130 [Penaeus vannamei]|uniref:Uncharacterized protein n=1 Tax=Penaeus vannamei TaxID=6689 RepID=A0A3R7LS69_PENVA|nr:hypothetical protein C7M84_019130 [Penaeus vannamei]